MSKFRRHTAPPHWRHEWSEHPEGYTIMEALLNWLDHLNKVTDNVNNWNDYLDDFVNKFAEELQEEVRVLIRQWDEDGTMARIINEEIFGQLNSKVDGVQKSVNDLGKKTTADLKDLSVAINGTNVGVSVAGAKSPSPTLVIIDDDTRNELYSLLFPYMKSRNLPFTSALISSRIGVNSNTITYEQFKEMKDSGIVEFVNHTHEHIDLTTLTDAQAVEQVRKCEEWLRNEGIYTRHLVYPFGKYAHKFRRLFNKYVDSATIVGSQVFRPDIHILDTWQIRRTTLETDMGTIKARLDMAADMRGMMVLNVHAQFPEFSIARLEEVINYAQSLGIEITTFSRAFHNFSNILELRRNDELITGISCTGYTEGIKDYQVLHPNSTTLVDRHANDGIDRYPALQTSEITFTGARATSQGWPSAGTLITHRKHNDDYAYQEFKKIRSNDLMTRYWTSAGTWSAWRTI